MHLSANTFLRGGTYRIIRFICSGGFGCTYEAEHVMLEKRVAIKEFFVKDFCNRDETTAHITVGTISKKGLVEKLRHKFIDEAKALCRLQHPGIVCVSDVFEENGTAYFVMGYVNGKSLGELVKEHGALPEGQALRYMKQVAAALQYVHNNNILHLDIKPANIMIDDNDNPVLIDFGASKQYDEDAGENTSTLIGKTPGYAPPEQMSNCVVKFTPATDIYALGATFYKMLSGITPLDANLRISGEELEPLPSNTSAATRTAIVAAMQINKDKRPKTLSGFLKLLQEPPIVDEDDVTEFGTPDADAQTVITAHTRQLDRGSIPKASSKLPFSNRYVFYAFLALILFIMILAGLLFGGRQNTSPQELTVDTLVVADSVEQAIGEIVTKDVSMFANNKKSQSQQTDLSKRNNRGRVIKHTSQTDKKNNAGKDRNSKQTAAENATTLESDKVFDVVERNASFPGGEEAWYEWLGKNIKYPQICQEQGVQGRVIVGFVVNCDGSIVDVKILRSPDENLSKEAERVVKLMPKWNPAMQGEKAVRSRFTIPILFHLN